MQHRPPASALPVINATGPQSTVPLATLASRQSTVPELAPASARRGLTSLSHQLRSGMQTPQQSFDSITGMLGTALGGRGSTVPMAPSRGAFDTQPALLDQLLRFGLSGLGGGVPPNRGRMDAFASLLSSVSQDRHMSPLADRAPGTMLAHTISPTPSVPKSWWDTLPPERAEEEEEDVFAEGEYERRMSDKLWEIGETIEHLRPTFPNKVKNRTDNYWDAAPPIDWTKHNKNERTRGSGVPTVDANTPIPNTDPGKSTKNKNAGSDPETLPSDEANISIPLDVLNALLPVVALQLVRRLIELKLFSAPISQPDPTGRQDPYPTGPPRTLLERLAPWILSRSDPYVSANKGPIRDVRPQITDPSPIEGGGWVRGAPVRGGDSR